MRYRVEYVIERDCDEDVDGGLVVADRPSGVVVVTLDRLLYTILVRPFQTELIPHLGHRAACSQSQMAEIYILFFFLIRVFIKCTQLRSDNLCIKRICYVMLDFGQFGSAEQQADDVCVRLARYDFLLVFYSNLRSRWSR